MLVRLDIYLVDHFQVPERRLNLVSVQVADKAAVIGFAIFRTRAGCAFTFSSGL